MTKMAAMPLYGKNRPKAASELKGRRSRHLIEFTKVCEVQGHFITIYFPGFVCFVLYWAKTSGERLPLVLWVIFCSLMAMSLDVPLMVYIYIYIYSPQKNQRTSTSVFPLFNTESLIFKIENIFFKFKSHLK